MRILFCQLAAAMTYCHKEHVVHRDLKCENILLDGEGKLKVTGEIKPRYRRNQDREWIPIDWLRRSRLPDGLSFYITRIFNEFVICSSR